MDFDDDQFWLEEDDYAFDESLEVDEELLDERDELEMQYEKLIKKYPISGLVVQEIGEERPDPDAVEEDIDWLRTAIDVVRRWQAEQMEDYKGYISKEYPRVDPRAAPLVQARQEARIRRELGPGGAEAKRERKKTEFMQGLEERQARERSRIHEMTQEKVKDIYVEKVKCTNLTKEQQQTIPLERLIKLRVRDKDSQSDRKHTVCYDILTLYESLISGGGLSRGALWIDPTHRTLLSETQRRRIIDHYKKVSPCPITNFAMELRAEPMSSLKSASSKEDQASFPPSVLEMALREGKIEEGGPIIFKVLNQTHKADKVRSGFLTALDFDAAPGTIELHPSTMKKFGLSEADSTTGRGLFVGEELLISECPLPKVRKATITPIFRDWYEILGTSSEDLEEFMKTLEQEFRRMTTVSAGDTISLDPPEGDKVVLQVKEILDESGRSLTSGVVIETDIDLTLDW